MILLTIAACVLVALTVAVHALGITVLLLHLRRRNALLQTDFWPIVRMLIGIIWWMILCHMVDVFVWAVAYVGLGCLADLESAVYFSGVTYATIGYGDVVLQAPWRLLAPIEGLTGILLCGLSAGIFFAVVSSLYKLKHGGNEFR